MSVTTGPDFLTCPAVPELTAPGGSSRAPGNAPPPLPEPRERRPNPTVRRAGLLLILGTVAVLLILASPLVYGGVIAGRGALAAQSALKQAQAHLEAREFSEALVQVDQAEASLADVADGLRATGAWRSFPWIGSRLRALEDLGRAGSTALSGIRELVAVAASIEQALAAQVADAGSAVAPDRSFQDLTPEEKRLILSRLDASLPQMKLARERIEIAADAWERIPKDELLAPARRALEPLVARLPDLRRQLEESIALLEIVLPLAGYPEAKTYLLLLQNSDELRATGGFIGNVGEVTIDAADFEKIDFKDVYAVDDPVANTWNERPPEIMQRELGVRAWFLRDANWSPDFPESGSRIMDFYERETKLGTGRDVHLDSVVALQPGFFRDLLRLTGPIVIEGKTFNADNFFDQLQYDVEIGFLSEGIPVPQRKEIVAKIGDALLEKLTSQPAGQWPAIVDIVSRSLERKDILIYSRNASLQSLLDARSWSGRTLGTDHDYMWVVDSNLAALKTDGVMDKEIHYSIDTSDPAGPIATVRLRYTNTNRTIDWRYTRYRSYTRVYVPDGSELLSWTGVARPDVYRELGKRVYGGFWVIEPGRTGELVFRYRLPARIASEIQAGEYDLTVQKQPGSKAGLTLDLAFGKNLRTAVPAEDEEQFGDNRYRYETALPSDQTFTVELSP